MKSLSGPNLVRPREAAAKNVSGESSIRLQEGQLGGDLPSSMFNSEVQKMGLQKNNCREPKRTL